MTTSRTAAGGRAGVRWARGAALVLVAAGAWLLWGAGSAGADPVHGPYSLKTNQCATCHRTHAAPGRNLLATERQPELCLTCHDGSGAAVDVTAQFAVGAANDVDTRTFFRHDPAQSTHTLAIDDEFAGVMNRHSTCSDCHNPHSETGAKAQNPVQGLPWTPSGQLAGTSGVVLTHSPTAGDPPSYTFVDGRSTFVSSEYQVCLKCHSGFTELLRNQGYPASQWTLDKGIELNPANASFHPVSIAGTNKTSKMTASLQGPSAYKAWTFSVDDTVRCTNCHAGGLDVPATAAGTLPTHGSANRGILLAPYRDRELKGPGEDYQAVDFALCYLCHSDEPFKPSGDESSRTNFSLHQKHMIDIAGKGTDPTTSIDTAGAGKGDAICAECHFRLHSTALATPGAGRGNTRLVNFSPNVTPNNGTLEWTPNGTGKGSCTLTCHGEQHDAEDYG